MGLEWISNGPDDWAKVSDDDDDYLLVLSLEILVASLLNQGPIHP